MVSPFLALEAPQDVLQKCNIAIGIYSDTALFSRFHTIVYMHAVTGLYNTDKAADCYRNSEQTSIVCVAFAAPSSVEATAITAATTTRWTLIRFGTKSV